MFGSITVHHTMWLNLTKTCEILLIDKDGRFVEGFEKPQPCLELCSSDSTNVT